MKRYNNEELANFQNHAMWMDNKRAAVDMLTIQNELLLRLIDLEKERTT